MEFSVNVYFELKEIIQINTNFAHEHDYGKAASFKLHKPCNDVQVLSCKDRQREGFVSKVTIYFDTTVSLNRNYVCNNEHE